MKQKLYLGSERTRPNGSAGRALRPVYSLPWSKRVASTLLPGRIPPMNTKKLKPQIKCWGSLKEWGKFKLYYRVQRNLIFNYIAAREIQELKTMRKFYMIFLLAVVNVGCAGIRKVVYSPVGTWEYVVTGTPSGDTNGTFILTKPDDVFTGSFKSAEYGETEMENLYYADGKITCQFYLAGIDLSMSGVFAGDTFSGTIDSGQMGVFPITANHVTGK